MESERAGIKAGDLRPGMTLHTPSSDTAEATANRHFDKRQRTHDLTVTGVHAYYVLAGQSPLLVHNCDPLADYADSLQPKAGKKSVRYASEYTDANGKRAQREPGRVGPSRSPRGRGRSATASTPRPLP
ncbi:hypothetical protein ACFSL4_01255 [Streptomyces caeni]|uniref:Intein C-terminal splicing domain-containing protein n=1 Tax=Streptomyces caeni TaxID=2307231 RepID=A0ABW4IHV3_9ACTN